MHGTTSAACSLLISGGAEGLATVDMEVVANQENEFEALEQLQTEIRFEQASIASATLSLIKHALPEHIVHRLQHQHAS